MQLWSVLSECNICHSVFPVTWRLWCIWFTHTNTTRSFCQKGCTEGTMRSFSVITVESVCWWGSASSVNSLLKLVDMFIPFCHIVSFKQSDYKVDISSVQCVFWNRHLCVQQLFPLWSLALICHSLSSLSNFPFKSDSAKRTWPDISPSIPSCGTKIKLLLLRYCFGLLAAHKRFHWRFFIWYWWMKIFSELLMWAPFHFSPSKLQVVLWCYWLGLRVFWSDQSHTGLAAALSNLTPALCL